MKALCSLASAAAFTASMCVGAYLVLHDHVILGGWICILSLLGKWGFEQTK